ncbi:hypothetical protein PoB_004230500 [Plakobranchus ocellatus]|uniref:Uncharacterized protein n=1 Tax=Plakobranchus ocellatus TaxID=259542 RepID=A0AAV4B8F7_9GAST|nr:hypothetical protein PoB_004230500 [Plakobranchus ocellatus]
MPSRPSQLPYTTTKHHFPFPRPPHTPVTTRVPTSVQYKLMYLTQTRCIGRRTDFFFRIPSPCLNNDRTLFIKTLTSVVTATQYCSDPWARNFRGWT